MNTIQMLVLGGVIAGILLVFVLMLLSRPNVHTVNVNESWQDMVKQMALDPLEIGVDWAEPGGSLTISRYQALEYVTKQAMPYAAYNARTRQLERLAASGTMLHEEQAARPPRDMMGRFVSGKRCKWCNSLWNESESRPGTCQNCGGPA